MAPEEICWSVESLSGEILSQSYTFAVLWIRNVLFRTRDQARNFYIFGSESYPYYLSIFGNYLKKHLKFNQREESINFLPFSISLYSPTVGTGTVYTTQSRIHSSKICINLYLSVH